jgi:glutathione synthase/RimK-type ligase-like ATP-grasp enzyme
MSAFILYHPKSGPTGRQLRDALGIPGGTRIRGNPERIIRWGSQRFPEAGGENTPSSLALASDKLRALRTLREAGILVPDFWTNTSLQERPGSGVVLGRARKGYGGTDIVAYGPEQVYPAAHEWYSAYVPNTREYRIHVFEERVIRVQGKYLDHPEQHTNPYVKNYAQGFRFRTPDKRLNSDRTEAAINAVSALGLLFGAVDLLIGEDRRAYVLEVNTAPKLAPLTCSQYASAIRGYLGLDEVEADGA